MISKYRMEWLTYDRDQVEVTVGRMADRDEHGKFRYEVKVYIDRVLLWQTDELYCPAFYDEIEVVIATIDFCVYDLEGKHGEEPQKWGVELAEDLNMLRVTMEDDDDFVYYYDEVQEDWWK